MEHELGDAVKNAKIQELIKATILPFIKDEHRAENITAGFINSLIKSILIEENQDAANEEKKANGGLYNEAFRQLLTSDFAKKNGTDESSLEKEPDIRGRQKKARIEFKKIN